MRVVPAPVPSLFHGSVPLVPSSAAKKTTPPTTCSSGDAKNASPEPGLMSATRVVPTAVPSVRHSSRPLEPSVATNSTVPPSAASAGRSYGANASALPGFTSAIRTVPASVPSLFHGSSPLAPSVATK